MMQRPVLWRPGAYYLQDAPEGEVRLRNIFLARIGTTRFFAVETYNGDRAAFYSSYRVPPDLTHGGHDTMYFDLGMRSVSDDAEIPAQEFYTVDREYPVDIEELLHELHTFDLTEYQGSNPGGRSPTGATPGSPTASGSATTASNSKATEEMAISKKFTAFKAHVKSVDLSSPTAYDKELAKILDLFLDFKITAAAEKLRCLKSAAIGATEVQLRRFFDEFPQCRSDDIEEAEAARLWTKLIDETLPTAFGVSTTGRFTDPLSAFRDLQLVVPAEFEIFYAKWLEIRLDIQQRERRQGKLTSDLGGQDRTLSDFVAKLPDDMRRGITSGEVPVLYVDPAPISPAVLRVNPLADRSAVSACRRWLSSRGVQTRSSSAACTLSSAVPPVAAAPTDPTSSITTCHRCGGNCHIRTSCPNANVDSAEARQLASSGTRCTFWYSRSGVYCDGRGHVSRHHRIAPTGGAQGKQGKGFSSPARKGSVSDSWGSKSNGPGKGGKASAGKFGGGKSKGKHDRVVAGVGDDESWDDGWGYEDAFDGDEQYPEWNDEEQLECPPVVDTPVAAVTAPPPGLTPTTAPPDVIAAAPSEEELRQGFIGDVLCGAITTADVASADATVEELVALLEQNQVRVSDSSCVGRFQFHQKLPHDEPFESVTAAVLQDLQWDADNDADGKPCYNRHSTYRAQFSIGGSTVQGHPDPGSAKNFLKENFFEAVRKVHPGQVLDVWGALQPVFTFSKDKKLIEKACVLRTRVVGDCGRYFEISIVYLVFALLFCLLLVGWPTLCALRWAPYYAQNSDSRAWSHAGSHFGIRGITQTFDHDSATQILSDDQVSAWAWQHEKEDLPIAAVVDPESYKRRVRMLYHGKWEELEKAIAEKDAQRAQARAEALPPSSPAYAAKCVQHVRDDPHYSSLPPDVLEKWCQVVADFSDILWLPGRPNRTCNFEPVSVELDEKKMATARGLFGPEFTRDDWDDYRLATHFRWLEEDGKTYKRTSGSRFRSSPFMADQEGKGVLGRPVVAVVKPNTVVVKKQWAQNDASAMLARAAKAKIHSITDYPDGYHQMQADELTQEVYTIGFRRELISMSVCGFGGATYPFEFQSRMDRTHANDPNTEAFLDDGHTGTGNAVQQFAASDVTPHDYLEHIRHLESVTFPAIRAANWLLSLTKSKFLRLEVPLLGYKVGYGGVRVAEKKLQLFQELPFPRSLADVVSHRCLANWLGKRIALFGHLCHHLNKYSKKGATFDAFLRDDRARDACTMLSKLLTEKLFQPPTGEGDLVCYCDASDYGVGYLLVEYYNEKNPTAEPRLCDAGFFSFGGCQLFWTVTEKESCAKKFSIEGTRVLVNGRPCEIRSDHLPITYAAELSSRRVIRKHIAWAIYCDEIGPNYFTTFVAGEENVAADFLSRQVRDQRVDIDPLSAFSPVRQAMLRLLGIRLSTEDAQRLSQLVPKHDDVAAKRGAHARRRGDDESAVTAAVTAALTTSSTSSVGAFTRAALAQASAADVREVFSACAEHFGNAVELSLDGAATDADPTTLQPTHVSEQPYLPVGAVSLSARKRAAQRLPVLGSVYNVTHVYQYDDSAKQPGFIVQFSSAGYTRRDGEKKKQLFLGWSALGRQRAARILQFVVRGAGESSGKKALLEQVDAFVIQADAADADVVWYDDDAEYLPSSPAPPPPDGASSAQQELPLPPESPAPQPSGAAAPPPAPVVPAPAPPAGPSPAMPPTADGWFAAASAQLLGEFSSVYPTVDLETLLGEQRPAVERATPGFRQDLRQDSSSQLWFRRVFDDFANEFCYRVFVPKNSATLHKLIQLTHVDFLVGQHQGANATYHKLRKIIFAPDLARTVRKVVRRCKVCRLSKAGPTENLAEVPQHRSLPDLFEVIQVDFVGPISPKSAGNSYIITASCVLSGWCWFEAVPSATADEAAKFLLDSVIFDVGGVPLFRSDQGTHFTADLIKALARLCNSKWRFGAAYNARSQAVNERSHRSAWQTLRTYLHSVFLDAAGKPRFNQWARLVKPAQFAVRCSPRANLSGLTPYEFVFGRSPIDFGIRTDPSSNVEKELYKRLQAMHSVYTAIRNERREEYEEQYTKHVTDLWPAGAQVLVRKTPGEATVPGVTPSQQLLFELATVVEDYGATTLVSFVDGDGAKKINKRRLVRVSDALQNYSPE